MDAFDAPRFTYSVERKKYLPDNVFGKPEPNIYAGNVFSLLKELSFSSESWISLLNGGDASYCEKPKINVRACCFVTLPSWNNLTINRLVALIRTSAK